MSVGTSGVRPIITPVSQPWWDALGQETISAQYCEGCDRWVHYPRVRCPHCGGIELVFRKAPTVGTIHSFTIAVQPTAPPFAGQGPQIIALVELDRGLMVTTTLVADEPSLIRIGDAVRAIFAHGEDGITTLHFRHPASSNEAEPPQS